MVALTEHLKPAPYPYGLLCVRLVGKMGGTSRLFLREMVGLRVGKDAQADGKSSEKRRARRDGMNSLSLYCK